MKDIDTLLEEIRTTFTPFAFLCDCDSEHCEKVRTQDRYALGQAHTVERIVEYLRRALAE